MTEVQNCTGNQHSFDLSTLPAERIETNRKFGLCVAGFGLLILLFAGFFLSLTIEMGDPIFIGIASFFALFPLLIFVYGIVNFMTVIHTRIDSQSVEETRRSPIGSKSWNEPISAFQLQMKITTHRKENDSSLHYSYHIRLKHKDDFKSIELMTTDSPEQLREQYAAYKEQLNVKEDRHIRDFNTDEPIGDLKQYGLA